MRGANEAAREMWAPPTWEPRMSLAGNSQTFAARTNGRSTRRAPRSFCWQSMWQHRPDGGTPGCCGPCCKWIEPRWTWRFWGYKKLRCEADEAGAPLDRGRDGSIYPQPDRLEATCCCFFRLAWITASRWFEIAALTPNNSTLEADGTIISDWFVEPKTARADPHRASRFFRIRGQDAFDIIKLCRTLRRNEKLTNPTAAKVERALAPWNDTAHSIEQLR
ncbi:putative trans-sialidase [Trypanosoma cruzi]|nr:putative trans-sialidase [Trypanosoma cruzi]